MVRRMWQMMLGRGRDLGILLAMLLLARELERKLSERLSKADSLEVIGRGMKGRAATEVGVERDNTEGTDPEAERDGDTDQEVAIDIGAEDPGLMIVKLGEKEVEAASGESGDIEVGVRIGRGRGRGKNGRGDENILTGREDLGLLTIGKRGSLQNGQNLAGLDDD